MTIRKIVAMAGCAALLTTSGCSSSSNGAAGGEVAVGAILSMSGFLATLGPPEKNAIEMGVEELNKQGFIVAGKTYRLKFLYADDKSDWATTGVAALRQMVQVDNVPIVAFGAGSAAYGTQLQRTPIPMINILDSTYPSILGYSDHIYLMRGDSVTYVAGCVGYAKSRLNAKSIGIINTKGEPYSDGLVQLVQKAATEQGVTVAGYADVDMGATDYSAGIAKVLASKPDLVYLGSVTSIMLPVLKQLRQAGYSGPVMHSSGVNPNQAEAILGAQFNDLMKDNYDCAGTLPTTSDNPAAKAFAKSYQARYNEYPQDLTMWAYDLPFVIAAAMSKAATVSDRAKIEAALPQLAEPTGTVSGWLETDGKMFVDRDARTLSEITVWCPDKKTIASAMVFDGLGGKVTDPKYRDNPCASVG